MGDICSLVKSLFFPESRAICERIGLFMRKAPEPEKRMAVPLIFMVSIESIPRTSTVSISFKEIDNAREPEIRAKKLKGRIITRSFVKMISTLVAKILRWSRPTSLAILISPERNSTTHLFTHYVLTGTYVLRRSHLLTLIIQYIEFVQQKIGKFCTLAALCMMCLGALNAILRHLSSVFDKNLSSNSYLEGQWYLFSALFLLGAGYTLKNNRHVRVDVFYSRLSTRTQMIINLSGHLLLLIPFCIFGVWSSYSFVYESWLIQEVSPDAGGLIRYPVKMLIPLAFVLLGTQGLVEIIRCVQGLRGKRA